ncbi:hypothetical protein CTAYLR_010534 [Chrysophaeum taylorii]|uniref:lipoyl(octanoyl) transferase n=1 Tax=Chrysophaeum taylorii TaxID=2483200 RepID=A0AAD7UJC5_9STRA|nr:hypothetical protein CTAYLR_010534 [Chrysophaeum taylorii]
MRYSTLALTAGCALGARRRLAVLSKQAQGTWEVLGRGVGGPAVSVVDLTPSGPANYEATMALQRRLVEERVGNRSTDALMVVEHESVYTLGRGATEEHVLFDSGAEDAPSLVRAERGGDVTYHGPGQLVAYPVLQLADYKRDSHWYLRALEEVVIRTCGEFGAEARRHDEHSGVWIGGRKVAAVGVALRKWVTYHGVSLNVDTDMGAFDRIVPCGLREEPVGSLVQILDRAVGIQDVLPVFLDHFAAVFEARLVSENRKKERRSPPPDAFVFDQRGR